MLGGYAMSAITAITAQNTLGVQAVEPLSPELVAAQIDSCLSDIGVDVVKIGMLAVSYTHLLAHETVLDLVCRLLLEQNKKQLHTSPTAVQ